jgi:DNA mismatch repair protein MSH5
MRIQYDAMEFFLTTIVSELDKQLPHWARPYLQKCIFFPQLGFLTTVQIDSRGMAHYGGGGHGLDKWEGLFIAGQSAYFKNQRMRELDRHFGDMYCMIIGKFPVALLGLYTKYSRQRD